MPQDNTQLALPPAEQASQVRASIVQDVFFAKMAEYGVVPRTQDEAAAMLRTGQQCLALQQHPAVKQASQQGNPFLEAERRLTELSSQYGFDTAKTAAEKTALNQISLAYAQEPDVYKAMLSLARAESQVSAG